MNKVASKRPGAPVEVRQMGVTGHQDLPLEARAFVQRRLEELYEQAPRIRVVCSLAEGADSFVAERMLEHGARLRVIVPCARYEDTFSNSRHLDTYRTLLAKADSVEHLPF